MLHSVESFDFETRPAQLHVRVRASDPYGASVEGSFAVELKDIFENQPPTDLNSSGDLSILENQPAGTFVGEFTAVDPNGDAITFDLVDGEGAEHNGLFELSLNGVLHSVESFDFETRPAQLHVRVRASDPYGASVEGSFAVELKDIFENQPPTDLNSSGDLSILENQPAGTFVGEFTAVDPNGDAITFDLVDGEGAEHNGLFELSLNGVLHSVESFDFETRPAQLHVRVRASDPYGASVEGSFAVELKDIFENQPPTDLNSSGDLSILENQPAGTFVGEFTAVDPNGDAITFDLVDGEGAEHNGLFELSLNGVLHSVESFDFETRPAQLHVRVRASDPDGASVEQSFSIELVDVDENKAPEDLRTRSPLVIFENQPVGSVVGEFWQQIGMEMPSHLIFSKEIMITLCLCSKPMVPYAPERSLISKPARSMKFLSDQQINSINFLIN